MWKIWNDIGEALTIRTNSWLSELELEKIKGNLNQNFKENKRSNTGVLEWDTSEVDGHESNDEPIQREDCQTIIEEMQWEKKYENKTGIVRLLIEELKAEGP